MSANAVFHSPHYALATGLHAAGRLELLHRIYAPEGKQFLREAGLSADMCVADFGCGTGAMTRTIAELVGPSGCVTGIDVHAAQLQQARERCSDLGVTNAVFIEADATETGLPSNSFDLVYCRFLLLHLPDPMACLREMRRVLRPGGIIVVEDGDLAVAESIPATALNSFAGLFGRFGSLRSVDYSLANRLAHLVLRAGFSELACRVHQPADRLGVNALLLKWSVEEAASSFISAGLITDNDMQQLILQMESAIDDPDILTLGPRMSLVSGRK